MITLRGSGPAPYGYWTCRDRKCDAQRNPFTGRFQRIPNHYHPAPVGMDWLDAADRERIPGWQRING